MKHSVGPREQKEHGQFGTQNNFARHSELFTTRGAPWAPSPGTKLCVQYNYSMLCTSACSWRRRREGAPRRGQNARRMVPARRERCAAGVVMAGTRPAHGRRSNARDGRHRKRPTGAVAATGRTQLTLSHHIRVCTRVARPTRAMGQARGATRPQHALTNYTQKIYQYKITGLLTVNTHTAYIVHGAQTGGRPPFHAACGGQCPASATNDSKRRLSER